MNLRLDADGVDWDHDLASLPSRLRNSIAHDDRRLRRSHEFSVSIACGVDSPLELAIEGYETALAPKLELQGTLPAFMPSLCQSAAEQGWLRLGALSVKKEPVEASILFHCAGVASIYKMVYDETFANHGVGTVLVTAIFRHNLGMGRAVKIDLKTGDEPYKR